MSMNSGHWTREHTFVEAAILAPRVYGLALASDEMLGKQNPFSFLAVRRGADWLEGGSTPWDAVALTTASAPLVDVCCAGDRVVYAIGRGGTLVIGRGDAWIAKPTGAPVELSRLCWFAGHLYAASGRDIFMLNGQQDFEPIQIRGDYPKSAGVLVAAGDLMLSVGGKDLFAFDGARWTRID